MISRRKWEWIERDIEKNIQDSLKKGPILMSIQGKRRIGKCSTTLQLLDSLHLPYLIIYVAKDEKFMVRRFRLLLGCEMSKLPEVIPALWRRIKEGTVFVLKETQNCSSNFQLLIQELADRITLERPRGGLIVMGSYQPNVDSHPLHGFDNVFSVEAFNTREWKQLMDKQWISKPQLMLTLFSLFGGNPHLYRLCFDKMKVNNNTTRAEILKNVIDGGNQSMVKNIMRVDDEEGMSGQNSIETQVPFDNDTSYPLLQLITGVKETKVRLLDGRILDVHDDFGDMDDFEEKQLQSWIRSIVKDRCHYEIQPFPHRDFSFLKKVTPHLQCGKLKGVDTGIDLTCKFANRKNGSRRQTLVLCSVKRQFNQLDCTNLISHVEEFTKLENTNNTDIILVFIGAEATWKQKFDFVSRCPMKYPCYAFDLRDMLHFPRFINFDLRRSVTSFMFKVRQEWKRNSYIIDKRIQQPASKTPVPVQKEPDNERSLATKNSEPIQTSEQSDPTTITQPPTACSRSCTPQPKLLMTIIRTEGNYFGQ